MVKMAMLWHEECLKNALIYEETLIKQYNQIKEQLTDLIRKNVFYARQIEEAKIRKLKGFDSEKFFKMKVK